MTFTGVVPQDQPTYDQRLERTSLYVPTGTTTFAGNSRVSTVTIVNDFNDQSGDGNRASGIDLRESALKAAGVKYFFPNLDDVDATTLYGKSMKVVAVKFDKGSNYREIPTKHIPRFSIDPPNSH